MNRYTHLGALSPIVHNWKTDPYSAAGLSAKRLDVALQIPTYLTGNKNLWERPNNHKEILPMKTSYRCYTYLPDRLQF